MARITRRLYRQLADYFRSRGVKNQRKIDELTVRWFRQKGKRPPVLSEETGNE